MNRFAYRLPGADEIVTGCSERLLQGYCTEAGFVVAPFDGDPAMTFTIPADREGSLREILKDPQKMSCSQLPGGSTTRDQHRNCVTEVIGRIKAGELKKCVIARAIVSDYMVDAEETFLNLCRELPDALVFAFDSEPTGFWIGATPELLVSKNGSEFSSMALAGTRSAGTPGCWDAKNLHEQMVVRKFISSAFKQLGLEVEVGATVTKIAGPVEHIATTIRGIDRQRAGVTLHDVATQLSPTPALSGFPREHAIKLIRDTEDFDRTYYGGYCGPVDAEGNGRLFVNLRSMRIEYCRFCLYAGGGIMADSDPDAEWVETCRKASTLEKNIKYWP